MLTSVNIHNEPVSRINIGPSDKLLYNGTPLYLYNNVGIGEIFLPDALYKAHPGGGPGMAGPRELLDLTIVRHQHTIALLAVCEHRAHRSSVAPFGFLHYTANIMKVPSLVSSCLDQRKLTCGWWK